MTISKNSVLYKYTYSWYDKPENNQTNLCEFFWRFILAVTAFPILLLILGCITAILCTILEIIYVAFGFYFPITLPVPDVEGQKKITWLPTIKGFRILPIYPLTIIGLSCLFWQYPEETSRIFILLLCLAIVATCLISFCLLVVSFKKSFGSLKNSSVYQLTIAYIKAKKEHVCPLITFVEEQTATDTTLGGAK